MICYLLKDKIPQTFQLWFNPLNCLAGLCLSRVGSSRKKCIEWNTWKKSCQPNKVGSLQFSFVLTCLQNILSVAGFAHFSSVTQQLHIQPIIWGKFLPCFDLRLWWLEKTSKPVPPMFVEGWIYYVRKYASTDITLHKITAWVVVEKPISLGNFGININKHCRSSKSLTEILKPHQTQRSLARYTG